MNKILIIEDDLKLKKYMQEYLNAYDYKTILLNDFDNVLEDVQHIEPNLIILDINLPTFDGFYFLKIIRNKSNVPVIIVSARSEEGEQIRGMELGADDYITKPFGMGILLAKVNAVLRRTNNVVTTEDFNICGLTLNSDSMRLVFEEKIVDLSKNEYKLLKLFMSNCGKVITREELLETLWDDTDFIDDNTLTVNITRVKKKLKDLEVENSIVTKRGVGYVFN
ncbi:response regulator transcription factor [Clostridium estertheticum]|uniref:Stage 0 sporulation protein A homolog n=1 Tax=Clostridium estertheticum subsp. estertheticum TaxID=1552 RepID=A0A1J0GLI6_9CLOT|nr:response regulator transcription factor [Clostridium estertheticum]APC41758.1 DNA-binding response regulator [Clostridium estertheticum subsp. estertheticum]MBU3073405.1 response regulator transcription factor [Clostridium estertheticum]MBU3163354.1 response regulator transcription factor [Clostridium estertheticum]MBZ9616357.1 response regulator transcription factor [Clostridium estertheticum subsp. laramiense]WAG72093.1 response regulator transcription factor [Clostridium estertheticum]